MSTHYGPPIYDYAHRDKTDEWDFRQSIEREQDDIDELLAERAAVINKNGDYDMAATISQEIKGAVKEPTEFGDRAPEYMLEAVDMIANKLARIACGDPYHIDHWKDIAGYAKLVVAELERRERPNGHDILHGLEPFRL